MTTTTTPQQDLDILAKLGEPDILADPYPFYAWLRENAPVHANPTGGVYLVSRNADCRDVYQSHADLRAIEISELAATHPRWHSSRALRILSQVITSTNPPDHTRIRRVVSRHFTLRRAQLLQAAAERHCDRLLAELMAKLEAGEPVDLHRELTLPMGIHMAGDIIGIPESDRAIMTEWILRVLASIHPASSDEALATGNEASGQVEDRFTALAAERRGNPTEDLISALVLEVKEGNGGPGEGLSWDEFLYLLWGVWAGSFDTTVTAMDSGVLAMLDFPDEAHWLDDGPEAVTAFVNETLRHSPPVLVDAIPRIAVRDLEFSGVTIPKGADVRPLPGAANRDPEAFPVPDRFDPSRNTSRMITFGYGIHHCLGANLARMECGVLLTRIRKALPGLALPERPAMRTSMSLRGFERFPVALDSLSR